MTAQVLVQIGGFTLPALLPTYIPLGYHEDRGRMAHRHLFRGLRDGGSRSGFADGPDAGRRVYMVGAGLTACSHLGFVLLADGFWSGLILRAIAGIGWAGAYMPGLKAIADTLEGNAQIPRCFHARGRGWRCRRGIIRRIGHDRHHVRPHRGISVRRDRGNGCPDDRVVRDA